MSDARIAELEKRVAELERLVGGLYWPPKQMHPGFMTLPALPNTIPATHKFQTGWPLSDPATGDPA